MSVNIKLINFPKYFRDYYNLEQKISTCVKKFYPNLTYVKTNCTINGLEHHIKISVTSGKMITCVNATSIDLVNSIDKALNKLEASLRKISKRKIHKRSEFSQVEYNSDYNVTNLRHQKRFQRKNENIFDRYESHYVSNFEDQTRKVS